MLDANLVADSDVRILLLQEPAHAGEGAAGARAHDKGIQRPLALLPKLLQNADVNVFGTFRQLGYLIWGSVK